MSLQRKTVLVTGATGFLGGALARELAQQGAQVKALARRPNRDRYIRNVENIEIVQGDITNADSLKPIMQGVDIVYHSAAALGGTYELQYAVNVEGTRNIVQAAIDANVQRFVHISSVAVYGYRTYGDVSEDTPPNPIHDVYGETKLGAEQVLIELAEKHDLKYTIIRPGMIYGARSHPWTLSMFKLAKRRVIFVGDGHGSCFPVHVDDVVGLTVHASTHENAVNQIFNASPDPSPTWREFLGAYAQLAGHDRWIAIPPILLKPVAWLGGLMMPRHSPLKALPDLLPFSQQTIHYKMDKANRMLGWQNRVSLQDGIASTEDYLREKGVLK